MITTSRHKMILISVGDYKGEKLIITRQMVRCLTVKLQILTQDTQKNPLHMSKATTANDNVSLGNNNMKFLHFSNPRTRGEKMCYSVCNNFS